MELLENIHIIFYVVAGLFFVKTMKNVWEDFDDEKFFFPLVLNLAILALGLGQQFLSDMSFLVSLFWFFVITIVCTIIEVLVILGVAFVKNAIDNHIDIKKARKEQGLTTP